MKELKCLEEEDIPSFLCALVSLATAEGSGESFARSLAGLMLELVLPGLWAELDPTGKEWVKKRLVLSLSGDSHDIIRAGMLDVIAVVVRLEFGGGNSAGSFECGAWPALFETTLAFLVSEVWHERRNALEVIGLLFRAFSGPAVLDNHSDLVMAALRNGLIGESVSIRTAAVRSVLGIFRAVGASVPFPVQKLSYLVLDMLRELVSEGQNKEARAVVELFPFADGTTFWAGPFLAEFGGLILQMSSIPPPESDTELHLLACASFEVLTKLFEENCHSCPIRYAVSLVPLIAPLVELSATKMLGSSEWNVEWDYLEKSEIDHGKLALRRIGSAVGGNIEIVIPVLECLASRFLQNEASCQHRVAGVLALAEFTQGCLSVTEEMEKYVRHALSFLRYRDSQSVVRKTAAEQLDQLFPM